MTRCDSLFGGESSRGSRWKESVTVLNTAKAVCRSITAEPIHTADILLLTAGVRECVVECVSFSLAALNVSWRKTEGFVSLTRFPGLTESRLNPVPTSTQLLTNNNQYWEFAQGKINRFKFENWRNACRQMIVSWHYTGLATLVYNVQKTDCGVEVIQN